MRQLATESQIRAKEREKASLENQIEQIRLARQELMDVGEDKLEAFRVNLNVLQSVWTSVAADTRIISGYLNGALEIAVCVHENMTRKRILTMSVVGYPGVDAVGFGECELRL